ncbi:MAG: type I glyceraldehyde-3-phosphate dehydrogenase [Fimbriimonadaceae bacterium]|nr:type I glyceraldehyde-3-phosphate dehydrogenase [Fimbriimonadaceae bacterium]
MARIGINGFGRIGRLSLRTLLTHYKGKHDVVAINDLTDTKTNAHLFKYDTTYGPWAGGVESAEGSITVDGDKFKVFAETDPAKIPWGDLGCDIVIESTGRFTDANAARAHITSGGAKKVVISAPAKNEDVTIVLGVNDGMYDAAKHSVISNASCTTNGLAPVAKVLHEKFGIEKGLLTTVHAYTNSQRTVDTAAKDLRDARAAAENVVPSSTGAAKAVGLVIPELKGKFTGMAFRVPVPTVSVVDFTAHLGRAASADEINAAMKEFADGPMKGILLYSDEPLVSSDLKGNPHSSVFSAVDTIVLDDMCKIVAWYDNEWGYSCRIADICDFIAAKGF